MDRDEQLHILESNGLDAITGLQKEIALASLEHGKVVFLPNYHFIDTSLVKAQLYSEQLLDGKHKNISFDYLTQRLGGYKKNTNNEKLCQALKSFMQGYAIFAKNLVATLCPQYNENLLWGRTSYRPAEIKGRASSKRKDDTRLHIDSFSATPVNGLRILRIFCNINPYQEPRIWHLGEPFAQVLQRFSSRLPHYNIALAKLLKLIKVTKSLRTDYDHYQLHLHDSMKLDDEYQNTVKKRCMNFPALSTWLVFTDQVSHAALGGQFLLEQTFYLPVEAMASPELSPLKHWEREKQISLTRS